MVETIEHSFKINTKRSVKFTKYYRNQQVIEKLGLVRNGNENKKEIKVEPRNVERDMVKNEVMKNSFSQYMSQQLSNDKEFKNIMVDLKNKKMITDRDNSFDNNNEEKVEDVEIKKEEGEGSLKTDCDNQLIKLTYIDYSKLNKIDKLLTDVEKSTIYNI